MQFKKTLLAIMICGGAAAHADYQAQINVSYAVGSAEYESDEHSDDYDRDEDIFQITGSVFFSPVSTANGPLDEAEFLSKSSGVAVGFAKRKEDRDYDISVDGDTTLDSDVKIIAGHFVLPNSNLIFEASVGSGKVEETDFDRYAVGFGGYINDRATLVVEYSTQKYDFDFADDESIDRFTVTYRQLIQLDGVQNLAIEPYIASVDYFEDSGAEIGIDVAWYVTPSLGLKAGLSGMAINADHGDYSEGHSSIGIDYFINENFRVGGELYSEVDEFEGDDGYYDDDTEGGGIEFDAAFRF